MTEKISVMYTAEEALQFLEILKNKEIQTVAYDTETTGLGKNAIIIGMSFSFTPGEGHYLVLAKWNVESQQLDWLPTKAIVPAILEVLKTKRLIMHNCIVDCMWTKNNFNIELMDYVSVDTMALAHLLDENRKVGLKELGSFEFGLSAKNEYEEMKASVIKNGGIWQERKKDAVKEMYKADAELLGKYGAKDAILTLNLFYLYMEKLFEQNLDEFFFIETMPLMRGPTYQMNTEGLKVNTAELEKLEFDIEKEMVSLKADIYSTVFPMVKDRYPATTKKNVFNINSTQQMAWLLFVKLGCEFQRLTDGGKSFAKDVVGKIPYNRYQKQKFIQECVELKKAPEKFIQCDLATMKTLVNKYIWVAKLIRYRNLKKILTVYVQGIKSKLDYGVIRPSFVQHGTTSGRYSSRNPNFQNLPKDDRRVKSCIIARDGHVFVGADYSQLEPRVFASLAGDKRLLDCFKLGQDFYSVVGIPIFKKEEYSAHSEDANSFASLFPYLRKNSKTVALAIPYGTTSFRMRGSLIDEFGQSLELEECQQIIDDYFTAYPQVHHLMLDSHKQVRSNGVIYSFFGRPRRIPEAARLNQIYGDTPANELPYAARTLLNLAMNHKIQSTAASIMNRAAVAFNEKIKKENISAKIVLQVHDELVIECKKEDADVIKGLLKTAMEQTSKLPGVDLIAEPKVATRLSDLK